MFKKFILSLFLITNLSANSCMNNFLDINIVNSVTIMDVISQLSDQCDFSVIVQSQISNEKLNQEISNIKIKDMTLLEIFDLILKDYDIGYTFENNVLKINYLVTKTFKLDYFSTQRTAKSNTGIQISGGGGSGTNSNQNSNTQQAGSTTTSTTDSGTTIESTDESNFWKEIKEEIKELLARTDTHVDVKEPLINKMAGLITVTGTNEQIKLVEDYIKRLEKRLQKQVLIDVKLYSVLLDKSNKTGIDWNQIFALQNVAIEYGKNFNKGSTKTAEEGATFADSATVAHTDPITNTITQTLDKAGSNRLNFTSGGSSVLTLNGAIEIKDIISFLKKNGDVKSISNPKVLTLNNQPALISVGKEIYYRQTQIVDTQNNANIQTRTGYDIKSIFAGVLLDITPSVFENDEIMLKINPSLSSIDSTLEKSSTTVREIPPDLNRKQLSSVIKVKDGEKIIMGGLISSNTNSNEQKVPILGDIPIMGELFKSNVDIESSEELVIVITPHIIEHGSKISLKKLGYKYDFSD
ncbi:MAG: pilus (MSHA type) biogenesis protein MshL [Campylobacterales bacterium]|nr:pilus (MSHA type) biogenesis protein MshL [Campylobacterales bacterium]